MQIEPNLTKHVEKVKREAVEYGLFGVAYVARRVARYDYEKVPPFHVMAAWAKTPEGIKDVTACGLVMRGFSRITHVLQDYSVTCPKCAKVADFQAVLDDHNRQRRLYEAKRKLEDAERDVDWNWTKLGREIEKAILDYARTCDEPVTLKASELVSLIEGSA